MTYDHEQTSSITFGGIPGFLKIEENREAFENSVSHRVSGDDHWMLKMNDIRVGDKTIEPSVSFALTDTGTSLIYLDEIDFDNLIKFVCENLDCFRIRYTGDELVWAVSDCSAEELPNIWFQLDRHLYKLAP